MRRITTTSSLCAALLLLQFGLAASSNTAQEIRPAHGGVYTTTASNLIIPQSRAYAVGRQADRVQIGEVSAEIQIVQQVATTGMTVTLKNPTDRQQEAEMLVPVPDGAVVRSFDFGGAGAEPSARLLPKDEAKATYYSIVSKLRDPALLEFAGYNLVRSSVFPVPARGTQTVKLVYENILPADGNRVDYVLPRSESFEAGETPWKITATVRSKTAVSTVYSPSHQITSEREASGGFRVRIPVEGKIDPGPFRLSYLVEGGGLTASLLAYPDARIGGGYFLLLAGVPAETRGERAASIKREVTLVIDRSGSMGGEKIEQARSAALQVLEALDEGEAFNVIDYSEQVAKFAEQPVVKNAQTIKEARAYVKHLKSDGGTNIHDALVEAMRQQTTPGVLPLTLFLTDGLPTSGVTGESAIRKAVVEANTHARRIFTFGVGYDVNAPLLTSIANATRATATFVLPKENVELKVSQVFAKLSGPVLADPRLSTLDASGQVTTRAVRELMPSELGDVFEGDQIVLLGQYQGEGPLTFQIEGNYLGTPRTFRLNFDLRSASTRNAFIPRLWASRKIARLTEEIRDAGADTQVARAGGGVPPSDQRLKELVDEIVRLSTEYGILTEYTSFLATDGTDFSRRDALNDEAQKNFVRNAQQTRSGMGGVTQAMNTSAQRGQTNLNRSNNFVTQNMQRVEITNVQQIVDRTFFRRGARWVDARLLDREKTVRPDAVVEFGTPEFVRLVDRLVAEGRQGILALSGEMLLMVDGKTVLIRAPSK
ncbi:MAG: VIT and VWA domain-containing protein [Acidobacteria bacterium]|nr:VIT and VWA domain-containing protein [Acidobacteriota bacterium]